MELSETRLFRGMTKEEISSLLACLAAREKRYRKGETILPEGKPVRQMGLVLAGRAILSSSDIWGNNSLLGSAAPGAVFAEAYACSPGEPLQIAVSAAEDTTVLFLDLQRVLSPCQAACGCHTALLRNLLAVSAQRSLQLSRRILHTRAKTIRGRLMSYFSECAKRTGSSSFLIPYNRQQLADYLNVDRSAMCNELSKMQKDGVIEYARNRILLKEQKGLDPLIKPPVP